MRHAEALLHHAAVLAEKRGITAELDWRILSAGICLHDLGSSKRRHARDSASMARNLLEELDSFTPREIDGIEEVILLHEDRTEQGAAQRKTAGIEAQILYDADQLDAMGVMGIYRFVSVFSERGASLEAIGEDARVRYDSLIFPESRALAEADYKYTDMFFDKFLKEAFPEGSLQGATGVVDFLRLHAGMPVVETTEKALKALSQQEESPDKQFAADFFSALKTVWLSIPSLVDERAKKAGPKTAEQLEPPAYKRVSEDVPQDIAALNREFHRAFAYDSPATAKKDAIREYLRVKIAYARTSVRFGIANNRIFQESDQLFIPYFLDRTLNVYRIHGGNSALLTSRPIPQGSILTDKSLMEMAGFQADALDLERELFGFGVDQAEAVQIARLGDLGSLLKKANESINLNESIYVLRFLVASLCG